VPGGGGGGGGGKGKGKANFRVSAARFSCLPLGKGEGGEDEEISWGGKKGYIN